jgi:hypothetical protein
MRFFFWGGGGQKAKKIKGGSGSEKLKQNRKKENVGIKQWVKNGQGKQNGDVAPFESGLI